MKAYQAGVEAAGRKEWPEVLKRMNEALATGHRDAREHFGTNRYYVDLYDPYYWRGAALMELGDDAGARKDLSRSRDAGLIRRFPEYGDLLARIDALDRRLAAEEAAAAPPTPTAATAALAAAPTVLAILTPTPTPPSVGRRRCHGRAGPRSLLGGRLRRRRGVPRGPQDRAPGRTGGRPAAEPRPGTRYVLEGETDPMLLGRARRALGAWREGGGSKRAEDALLSPSLRATLSGP